MNLTLSETPKTGLLASRPIYKYMLNQSENPGPMNLTKVNCTHAQVSGCGILISYCRFGNFCGNFIFANCIKRHHSDVKNSQLRLDLPISINDRVILPFCEGFIFRILRTFRENKVLAKFPNLQYERAHF